jgi:hypothetical protein
MRSEKYSAWYLVGKVGDCDAYWQPGVGTAIEKEHGRDGNGLVAYDGGVDWGPTMGLLRDYNENPGLLDAMPCGLRASILAFAHTVSRWDEEERMDALAKENGQVANVEDW